MTGVVYVAAAVLSFLSVGQSAPVTDCESLIQPVKIQDREQLLGKWIFIAESQTVEMFGEKLRENMWIKMTAANESDAINLYHTLKILGQCFAVRTKGTLENNTIFLLLPLSQSVTFLKSGCADCLVLHSYLNVGLQTQGRLHLLSRRTNVSTSELQEFKKQIECLNLPPHATLVTDTGLCPDESSFQEPENIDLTSFTKNHDAIISNLEKTLENNKKLLNVVSKLNKCMTALDGN